MNDPETGAVEHGRPLWLYALAAGSLNRGCDEDECRAVAANAGEAASMIDPTNVAKQIVRRSQGRVFASRKASVALVAAAHFEARLLSFIGCLPICECLVLGIHRSFLVAPGSVSSTRTQRTQRRRIKPAIDSRLVPNSTNDCGSGTSTGLEQLPANKQPEVVGCTEAPGLRRGTRTALITGESEIAFLFGVATW
jgi:hypothetical protein